MIPRGLRVFPFLALLAPLLGQERGNVLLIVGDDLGVDRVAAYAEHPTPGNTPTLDGLAARGVLFETCWSYPYCSPTRATILTGRYGFRTGIGMAMSPTIGEHGPSPEDWCLPRLVRRGSFEVFRTALVGKWHLQGGLDPATHANDVGFEHFAGTQSNLGRRTDPARVYFEWEKTVNGETHRVERYATTETVDDALEAIESFGASPWFVWVSFHAAHRPFHAPPAELHSFDLRGPDRKTDPLLHKAAVEAMDREIGRLLASLPAEVRAATTVIFVGDNGTPPPAMEAPWPGDQGKGTLHETGVRVPLLVAGPAVAEGARGRRCAALVHTVDLFATVAELAGVNPRELVGEGTALDSVSLLPYLSEPGRAPLRATLYAEEFRPNHAERPVVHERAVRGARFKLIRDEVLAEERFFDLVADPFERAPLETGALEGEAAAALESLRARLAELTAPQESSEGG